MIKWNGMESQWHWFIVSVRLYRPHSMGWFWLDEPLPSHAILDQYIGLSLYLCIFPNTKRGQCIGPMLSHPVKSFRDLGGLQKVLCVDYWMAVIISVFELRFGTSSQHTVFSDNRPKEPHESLIALLCGRLIYTTDLLCISWLLTLCVHVL